LEDKEKLNLKQSQPTC